MVSIQIVLLGWNQMLAIHVRRTLGPKRGAGDHERKAAGLNWKAQ